MTISWQVQQQILAAKDPSATTMFIADDSLRRELYGFVASRSTRGSRATHRRASHWTDDEHERFLQGLELFPSGPWKEVAAVVGTKTTRQTMTHAQKYRQKMERRTKLAVSLKEMAHEAKTPEPQQQQQQQQDVTFVDDLLEPFSASELTGADPMYFTTASPSFTMDGCVDYNAFVSEFVQSGVIV